MRINLPHPIRGNVLAEALMETTRSYQESLDVTMIKKGRLEVGSGKKVPDTLMLILVWNERTLTGSRFDFLLHRKITTGYGYSLHFPEIKMNKTYEELDIDMGTFSPWRDSDITPSSRIHLPKRPQDLEASQKLLEEFLDALFKNLGLIDEAPQGA